MEHVILVNEQDEEIGLSEKLAAHESGTLHRAFSVLIFNDQGEMLIHQRAVAKYHCGGLWTNACCSHQRQHESNADAAKRRLREEMGIETTVEHIGHFIYKVTFDNGLTEHELDHVFMGRFSAEPNVDPNEVESWKYIHLNDLREDIVRQPNNYTFWFKEIMNRFSNEITNYAKL